MYLVSFITYYIVPCSQLQQKGDSTGLDALICRMRAHRYYSIVAARYRENKRHLPACDVTHLTLGHVYIPMKVPERKLMSCRPWYSEHHAEVLQQHLHYFCEHFVCSDNPQESCLVINFPFQGILLCLTTILIQVSLYFFTLELVLFPKKGKEYKCHTILLIDSSSKNQ